MKDKSYSLAFVASIILHGIILALLIFMPMPKSTPMLAGKKLQHDIIKAVTVNQAQVEQEIQKIKQQQKQKKALKAKQLRRLQELAATAKHVRTREQARINKMRAEKKRMQAIIVKQKAEAKKQQQEILRRKQEIVRQAKLKAAEQKRKQEQALKKAQQELLQQQLVAEKKRIAAAQTKQLQSEIDKYKALIVAAISQNWLVPPGANKNLSCQLLINVGPGGVVLNVKVVRSSGNFALDNSAKTAVFKTSPLPVPKDPKLFNDFRQLQLTVKPESIIADG